MALNIGVNVVEVDGRSSPTIQAALTSVAAFLGLTERGVPNRPISVTSLQQFRNAFGNYRSDGYLAYAVEGFFLNSGQQAYINRVVGSGSVAASVTLNDREATAAPTLTITAGSRGFEDPGAWGNRLRIDVRDDPRGSTQLQADVAVGATSAPLQSLTGFQVGSVVRFVDGTNTFYCKITTINVASKTIGWDGSNPVATAISHTTAQVTSAEFRLTVYYQAVPPTGDFAVVEVWPNLSMEADSADYVVNTINQQFTGSLYITVADLSTGLPGAENPIVVSNQLLNETAGADDTPPALTTANYVGDAGLKTGLYAFDTAQVQLVAAPDAHLLTGTGWSTVVQEALAYCAGRGDCMFVGSAPDRGYASGVTIARSLSDYTQLESDYLNQTKLFSAPLQANKVYGALYAPWIQVLDSAGTGPNPTRFIPPEGHVMGVYARTDQERGIFKAPAGNAAQVLGALAVSAAFTDVQNTDMVRNGLVNGIRTLTGLGTIVTTSRTLSTDTRWWFVSTRLLFNFVKSSLRDGLRFVRQEPNTGELQRSVQFNVITPFLLDLWQRGAFGSSPPEQVFSVKCNAQNNPPDQVNLGYFTVEVYFYPVKPVETIILIIGQQPSGASATEG